MTKQTASNNFMLRQLKAKANAPIYKEASRLLNERGRAEMVEFLYTVDTEAFGTDK